MKIQVTVLLTGEVSKGTTTLCHVGYGPRSSRQTGHAAFPPPWRSSRITSKAGVILKLALYGAKPHNR